jgi:uncharacterized protein YegP (UPF0339 family)
MSSESSGVLVSVYSNRIGDPNTGGEVYGYWLFVVGLIAGILGIVLFLLSESSADMTRGAGITLGAVGLLLLIAGPIIRLELRALATYLTYAGSVVGLGALVWFLVAYPDNWVRGAGQAEAIIAVYAVGLALIAVGGVGVPLVGGRSARELEEELAAEQEAREQAEDAAETERSERERAEAETATERAARESAESAAETERQAREAVEDEISRIRDSQSQFELYEDAGGEYRWRLRHRNTNVIATSGEGYSARRKAQQGLAGVKRDAYGASVVDLERMDVEVDDADDATEGEDAVEYTPEVESQATFEQYEDDAGEYRWRLRHDNGEIIGDGGEGYSSKRNLKDAVERVRHYVQPADYLRVDPVAFELYTDNAHEWRWRLVHENGNTLADGGEGYSSRSKARRGIESVRKNAPEGGNADFEVYEDARGKYRWRLRHTNGNIIADSGQGYADESGAEKAVERVRTYAPDAPHLDIGTAAFEIYEDAGEEWRWRLRSRNGNTLGDSGEGYGSRRQAEEAVVRVKRHAPGAEAEWNE